jgi:hypothetical protein
VVGVEVSAHSCWIKLLVVRENKPKYVAVPGGAGGTVTVKEAARHGEAREKKERAASDNMRVFCFLRAKAKVRATVQELPTLCRRR